MQTNVSSQKGRHGFPTVALKLFLPDSSFSWWTGYVGLPPTHPLYGKDYMAEELAEIDCHGGLTYSGPALNIESIDTQFPTIWWFGFDCFHADDNPRFGGTVKDLPFVEAELENLARQFKEFTNATQDNR